MTLIEAIVTERAGVLSLARRQCGQMDTLVRSGQLARDDAAMLKQQLRAFADQVAQGLHVQTEDDGAVRAAMRAIIKDQEKTG